MAMDRLNELLENEPDFIKGLYSETCFRYDSQNIYGDTCKKVFEDHLLEAMPVNTLNMMLGGNLECYENGSN